MKLNKSFEICGGDVKPSSQTLLQLKISEFYSGNPAAIPVIVTHGKYQGPKMFLTGAIHGDELNGTEIIRKFNSQINPEELCGTIVALPVVNLFGFYTFSRVMPDGRDLDKFFPGNEKGSPASRISNIIFKEIILKCDFGVDFHTPRAKRIEIAHIETDFENEECVKLAKDFGASIVMNSNGSEKSLQYESTKANIPTIVFSGGEVIKIKKNITNAGVKGIQNILMSNNMIPGDFVKPRFSLNVKKNRSILSSRGGMLETTVDPGDLVYEGEEVGIVSNPFGKEVERITSPENGLIISKSTSPLINPGMEVCSYVMLDKSLDEVKKHN